MNPRIKWLIIVLLIVLMIIAVSIKVSGKGIDAGSEDVLLIRDITDDLPRGSGSYNQRDLGDITDIVVHHSASENQSAIDYANYHVNHHIWPGIGYHFVIQPNGEIFQTNRLETISYHVKDNNSYCLGICLSGNYSNKLPPEVQMQAAITLVRQLKAELPNLRAVNPHSFYRATGCPGLVDIDDIRRKSGFGLLA